MALAWLAGVDSWEIRHAQLLVFRLLEAIGPVDTASFHGSRVCGGQAMFAVNSVMLTGC